MGLNSLTCCTLCPRRCRADRTTSRGFCGAGASPEAAVVCLHTGEEPPLVQGRDAAHHGVVNLFFAHCNLQCTYCQNGDISAPHVDAALVRYTSLEGIADAIAQLLPSSSGILGLVTATHYAHLIAPLLAALRERGATPTVLYNSSGYETVETLRSLEGLVDIYLPDYKYSDAQLAARYSHAADYPEVAAEALQEMIRQVGSGLKTDEDGTAYRGIIVRHLVLPGHVDNSIRALDTLSSLTPFGGALHVSLMAQYYPPTPTLPPPLDRTVYPEEYRRVVEHYDSLGFDGWAQELCAHDTYRPHFADDAPFTPDRP